MLTRAPMGWNSWDCYGPSVTEETVRANARVMAEELKKYGWEYVVVDIQWYAPRASSHNYDPFADLSMDEYGRLLPAENRFPSAAGGQGFRPLADYVHSLGLKFGIHIMRGIPRQAVHRNTPVYGTKVHARDIAKTASICAWNTDMYGVDPARPGAREYYESIFSLYASWGVDFIKCDDICRELPHEEAELVLLSDCLKNCGREMVLSLSPGPALLEKAQLYKDCAQMWRITDDFWDKWELLYAMFERCEKWSIHTGPDSWPDADMLPLGAILQNQSPDHRSKFTPDEQQTMMILWCIFRSPLMMGGDLTKLDDATRALLTNEGLLSMHRDARHAHQVWRREVNGVETILWTAPRAGGGQYAAVFNAGEAPVTVSVPLTALELLAPCTEVRDILTGAPVPVTGTDDAAALTAALPAHGSRAYLISAT